MRCLLSFRCKEEEGEEEEEAAEVFVAEGNNRSETRQPTTGGRGVWVWVFFTHFGSVEFS